MNYQRIIIIIIVLFFINSGLLQAQTINKYIDKAQQDYDNKKYPSSTDNFLKAQVDNPDNQKLRYNIANSYYKSGDYLKALETYLIALKDKKDQIDKSKIYYNLGNSAYKSGNTSSALDYYLKAITLNPQDKDALQNYELTLKLEKDNKQKNQKNNNKNKSNKQNKPKNNESKDKDNNKNQQNQQNKDNKLNKNPENSKKQVNKQPQQQKIPQNQADMILSNIKEKRNIQNSKPQKGNYYSDKDW